MNSQIFQFLAILVAATTIYGCQTAPPASNSDAQTMSAASNATGANAETKVSTSQADATKTSVPPAGASSTVTATKLISVTPLSEYTDEWTVETEGGTYFSGAYTRIIVSGNMAADNATGQSTATGELIVVDSLPYEPRWWLTRALVGKEFSINLTANVSVGAYQATVPLATVGHQSNFDGEQWTRIIHHNDSGFPLFLVRTDGAASVPRIQITVKAANTYASRGAAAALGVAIQVAHAVSSTPSVVTRLTSDSTAKGAQAVDNAISKLFASGISEEHWTDRDLRKWSSSQAGGPNGVLLKFKIPVSETDYNSQASTVGTWRITFDYPRPSIFSDWHICPIPSLDRKALRCRPTAEGARAEVAKEVSPGEVLNYKLVNGVVELGTIRAFLAQQDWYATAVAAFANTDTAAANAAAAIYCRRVTNEITGLNLNEFDAGTVLWAVYKGMPISFPNFRAVPDCNVRMRAFEGRF